MAIVEQERVRERERLAEPDPVLLRAAEIVRERWGQGTPSFGSGGQACAMGAIAIAGGFDYFRWMPSDAESLRYAKALGFKNSCEVADWNDTEGRTADEVAEALERAAYGL